MQSKAYAMTRGVFPDDDNDLFSSKGGPQPATLQEVTIPIWSNAECRLKYGAAAPGGIVEHMLCAGKANMDSCSVSFIS